MTGPERASTGLLLLRLLATLLVLVFGLGAAALALLFYAYSTLGSPEPRSTALLVLGLLVIAALCVLLLVQTWRRGRRP